MIGWHCGTRLVRVSEDRLSFSVRCSTCFRVFTQRKRQSFSAGSRKPVIYSRVGFVPRSFPRDPEVEGFIAVLGGAEWVAC